jgi:hypothetical protein
VPKRSYRVGEMVVEISSSPFPDGIVGAWVNMADYSPLERRILSYYTDDWRDVSFIKPGSSVQVGEAAGSKVFEVQRLTKSGIVVKNLVSGVETCYSARDLWPVSPLAALARMSA